MTGSIHRFIEREAQHRAIERDETSVSKNRFQSNERENSSPQGPTSVHSQTRRRNREHLPNPFFSLPSAQVPLGGLEEAIVEASDPRLLLGPGHSENGSSLEGALIGRAQWWHGP